jgi:hypothetical protein
VPVTDQVVVTLGIPIPSTSKAFLTAIPRVTRRFLEGSLKIPRRSSFFPGRSSVLALRTIDGALVENVAETHGQGFTATTTID